ncbi:MAG TPA: hypothetical protein VG652_01045 [Gaiellaceae bacterium]|nr:hypothetical protein [Gaiellaceae bacterium]
MALPVWVVLGSVLIAQWAVVATIASIGKHNGYLFYGGGDETWYYTTAWVLGNGHMPEGYISYGYPFMLAPFARIAGANILQGLPLIVIFNVLVLVPVALLCVYGIAKTIGGRGFAYLVSLLWAVFPLLTLGYFYHRYHDKLINIGFVNELGLTSLGDFPSMVFLLVAVYFTLKALLLRSPFDALIAGAATGFAIAVKPSNAIFLPVPFAALILARYGRGFQLLAVGLIPALATLALWKYRGVGQLPLFANRESALAASRFPELPLAGIDIHRYISLNWTDFTNNMNQLKEYAWSRRLLGWFVVAGTVGLARRSGVIAMLIAGWFAVIFFLKAASPGVTILGGNFLRYFVPGYPALFVLIASTPLVLPVYGPRLASHGDAGAALPNRRSRKGILAIAAFLSFAPFLAIAILPPLTTPEAIKFPNLDQYMPANQFSVAATKHGQTVVLSWPRPSSAGARPFYDIFREESDTVSCELNPHAAASCVWAPRGADGGAAKPIGTTSATTFEDHPPAGSWVYHVVVKAAPTASKRFGDYLLVSRAATVN